MNSNRLNMTWNDYYKYAKAYYEKHGNLEIPFKFKTNNGVDYDEFGQINLGTWIYTQRKNISPESIRGKLLLQIGMRFENVKENKNQIKDICITNNIDLELNNEVISHISIQGLSSKIEFLKENGIPITDDFGKLHEIFSMSNINMQEIYGISLEDLISKYYIHTIEKRGK